MSNLYLCFKHHTEGLIHAQVSFHTPASTFLRLQPYGVTLEVPNALLVDVDEMDAHILTLN